MRVLSAGKHLSQIIFIQTELLLVVLNFLAESALSKIFENIRQRVALKFTKHFSQVYFLLFFFFCWLLLELSHCGLEPSCEDWRSAVEGEGAPFCPPMLSA